jgi:hypothetical protein
MTRFLLAAIILPLTSALTVPSALADSAKPLSGIKLICVWTLAGENELAVEEGVKQAKSLGFNAVCWNRPGLAAACHKLGLKAYAIVSPLERRETALLQVLKKGEEKLAGFDPGKTPPEQFYQYGGEPMQGKQEILDQNLACPNDPGVLEHSLKKVAELRDAGCDGVIWDFVGYRNYKSCECNLCLTELENFRKEHPKLDEEESKNSFYENTLVSLYDALYRETKRIAPNLNILNHIHPVFLPDIFYGRRVWVDYCGITVSWFFKPHWPLEKVREYTIKVLSGPYTHKEVNGMPMIGFYTDGQYARDRKSPERLEKEFEILKETGARNLIMCELGHILRDKDAARVVRRELADK